jgi:hypothetical protein
MLTALRDRVRTAFTEGKTEEQAIALQPAKEWEDLPRVGRVAPRSS